MTQFVKIDPRDDNFRETITRGMQQAPLARVRSIIETIGPLVARDVASPMDTLLHLVATAEMQRRLYLPIKTATTNTNPPVRGESVEGRKIRRVLNQAGVIFHVETSPGVEELIARNGDVWVRLELLT